MGTASVKRVTVMTTRFLRAPDAHYPPAVGSGRTRGTAPPKPPIGPIGAVLGPLSAYLREKRDRRVIDYDGDAADCSPTVRGDRHGKGHDRNTADHQKG